jgi:DNA replication protein DnaC
MTFAQINQPLLKTLNLSAMSISYPEVMAKSKNANWCPEKTLQHLLEIETDHRKEKKTENLIKQSGIPPQYTLDTLDPKLLTPKLRKSLPMLLEGNFVSMGENVLTFGLPGRGKSHYVGAIGRELILRHNKSVLFIPTFKLVEKLLNSKKLLNLENTLKKLDRFDVVILDDIGYVQQSREEMEVLFTFLAERYERKSLMITSNLVFSQWDKIFKDPMTTMAAVDRLIHHSVILDFTGPSIRKNLKQEE